MDYIDRRQVILSRILVVDDGETELWFKFLDYMNYSRFSDNTKFQSILKIPRVKLGLGGRFLDKFIYLIKAISE